MPEVEDLRGQVFGQWTVIRHAGKINRSHKWYCVCTCGNDGIIAAYSLKAKQGGSKKCWDCGKAQAALKVTVDITGYVFGEWKVIGFARKKNMHQYWNCLCSCGRKGVIEAGQLKSKRSAKCVTCRDTAARVNITGRRFSRLIAVKDTMRSGKQGGSIWLFQCDCGKSIRLKSNSVISGLQESCGCLVREKGFLQMNILHAARHRTKLFTVDYKEAFAQEKLQRELEQTGVFDHAPEEQQEIEQKLEVARTDVIPPWVKGTHNE